MAENTNDVGPWTDFQQPTQTGGGPWEDFQQAQSATKPSGPDWSKIGGMAINDILNLPSNVYQALKGAVTLPGNVYQGDAVVPQSANMPGGEDISQIGNVTNLAGMGVRPAIGTFGKTMPPTEAKLAAAKTAQYTQAESIPIALDSRALDLAGKSIKSQLGISPKLASTTFGILDDFSTLPYDSPVGMQKIREIQKSLGEIKNNNVDKTERWAAGSALNSFNYLLENLDQVPSALKQGTPGQAAEFSRLIKEANGNNTALENSRAFTKRGMDALYEANAANSGMNAEGRLNAKVAGILKNPKLMRGMSDETIEALRDYNGGSPTSNSMRLVSNLFGGGGGLGMVAAEGLGGYLGVPSGVLPGIGITLKSLSNKSAFNKFQNIGNMIRANSPLARSGEVSFSSGGILGRPRITVPLNPENLPQQSESP